MNKNDKVQQIDNFRGEQGQQGRYDTNSTTNYCYYYYLLRVRSSPVRKEGSKTSSLTQCVRNERTRASDKRNISKESPGGGRR